jgi:hypothetical protein
MCSRMPIRLGTRRKATAVAGAIGRFTTATRTGVRPLVDGAVVMSRSLAVSDTE